MALSGADGGGRSGGSHSFKWRRIFSMTAVSPIRLMIFSGPEQRGQTRGSASYTFLINRAQERLRPRANCSALSESSWCIPCAAAGGADADAGAAAETRRALEKAP